MSSTLLTETSISLTQESGFYLLLENSDSQSWTQQTPIILTFTETNPLNLSWTKKTLGSSGWTEESPDVVVIDNDWS